MEGTLTQQISRRGRSGQAPCAQAAAAAAAASRARRTRAAAAARWGTTPKTTPLSPDLNAGVMTHPFNMESRYGTVRPTTAPALPRDCARGARARACLAAPRRDRRETASVCASISVFPPFFPFSFSPPFYVPVVLLSTLLLLLLLLHVATIPYGQYWFRCFPPNSTTPNLFLSSPLFFFFSSFLPSLLSSSSISLHRLCAAAPLCPTGK